MAGVDPRVLLGLAPQIPLDPQIFKDLRFTKSGIFLRIASSRPSKRASFFVQGNLNFNQKAYLVAVGIYEYHARFSAMTGAWSVVIHCPWWYYLRKQTACLGREVNRFWNRPISFFFMEKIWMRIMTKQESISQSLPLRKGRVSMCLIRSVQAMTNVSRSMTVLPCFRSLRWQDLPLKWLRKLKRIHSHLAHSSDCASIIGYGNRDS